VTLGPTPATPAEAWAVLRAGNDRFVGSAMAHPSQGSEHRRELHAEQHPFAVVFGCSDSRVATELVFDQGLGDLFVVRAAGHVLDTATIGSVEYGVTVLGTPLVVVLGHDRCGAVGAAVTALTGGDVPGGAVRGVVDRVIPSIVGLTSSGRPLGSFGVDDLTHEHVRQTAVALGRYSTALAERIADGRCAVVAAEYAMVEGRVRVLATLGDIGEQPEDQA
jgi:carbonic anhydrase